MSTGSYFNKEELNFKIFAVTSIVSVDEILDRGFIQVRIFVHEDVIDLKILFMYTKLLLVFVQSSLYRKFLFVYLITWNHYKENYICISFFNLVVSVKARQREIKIKVESIIKSFQITSTLVPWIFVNVYVLKKILLFFL